MRIAQYEIIEELGRGGFGVVYKARDTRMGREVALKVIAGNFAQEPDSIERFRQEAMIAASLRHPRIVPVYDFGDADGTLYLAMVLITGRTLRQLLDERKRLALDQALPILTQLAEALDYLGSQGLVHRDVKPANVMIEHEDLGPWVMLTDFGLVRSLEASTHLTKTTSVLGTPDYMAPEQADPQKWGTITPQTDVYAFGVIAYEMLVGRQPFVGEMLTVLRAHADVPPPPPLELAPDLGADLAQALTRGLAKPPAERYPNAGALVTTLRQVAEARVHRQVQQTELAQLLAQIQTARAASDWLAVQSMCVQAMQIVRAHPDVMEMMAQATAGLQQEIAEEATRRKRGQRYHEGEQALASGKWQAAIAAFEEVAAGNPDFREVQKNLAQARDELQRAQWYDEAIAHAEANRWSDACRTWINVLRGHLDYHAGDAASRLLDTTEGLLAQFNREHNDLEAIRGLMALYDTMATAIMAQNWEYAATLGEQLLTLAPDLKCPPQWLARARQEIDKKPGPGQDRMTWEKDGKEMVRVPAGEFLYGDDKQKVSLPEFWVDKTPVTNAEYARFVAETKHEPPSHWKGKTPSKELATHPVVNVSWHDAKAYYAEWAGKHLPMEQEWEKAARGTDGRTYPWGKQEPTLRFCNYGNNERSTTPVGKYSPQGDSPYGCVDMAGNVWEWTASAYDQKSNKVAHGGSWKDDAKHVCTAYRNAWGPDSSDNSFGFRCVSVGTGQ